MSPHKRTPGRTIMLDVMRRTRAACGATEPREADEDDARRKSGCGLPWSADHAQNGLRKEVSYDNTAKRDRYRHRIIGYHTEWSEMHTHAHAQAVGGCKISPPVAIPLAPGRKTTGTAEFLHGSLWKESQFCRLPKQQEQRGSPQGQDSENDGKAVRQLSRTQYKYKPLRHMHHDTNTSNTSKHNDGNTTRRSRPREPSENEKGGPKKTDLHTKQNSR